MTLKKLVFVLLTVLIAILPFHTFVTVWLAQEFEHLYIWSAWKEIIVLLASFITLGILFHDPELRRSIFARIYNKIALAYLVLLCVYAVFNTHESQTFVSLAMHGRFILIFGVAQVVGCYRPRSFRLWGKIILITAVASAFYGLAQVSILPRDALVRFGYDPSGVNTAAIPPALQQAAVGSGLYRAQAALRGPNVLGAYLVLPILLCAQMFWTSRSKWFASTGVLLLICLYFTYSRSALLAILLAGGLSILLYSRPAYRRAVGYGTVALCLIGSAGILIFRNTDFVQSVVLHSSSQAKGVQSNEGHLQLSRAAAIQVVHAPLGNGLGSAGPASALSGKTNIAENYFLQVGQELGWLGLGLIVALHGYVLLALWRLRHDSLSSRTMLLVFAALSFTNLLLHTWTDEAIALTFWAMMGSLLGIHLDTKNKKPSLNEIVAGKARRQSAARLDS